MEATGCGGPAGEEVAVDQEACYGKDDYREGGHGPEEECVECWGSHCGVCFR